MSPLPSRPLTLSLSRWERILGGWPGVASLVAVELGTIGLSAAAAFGGKWLFTGVMLAPTAMATCVTEVLLLLLVIGRGTD